MTSAEHGYSDTSSKTMNQTPHVLRSNHERMVGLTSWPASCFSYSCPDIRDEGER